MFKKSQNLKIWFQNVKLAILAVRSTADNALFQHRYLFDFTLCFFTSIRLIWQMPQLNDS